MGTAGTYCPRGSTERGSHTVYAFKGQNDRGVHTPTRSTEKSVFYPTLPPLTAHNNKKLPAPGIHKLHPDPCTERLNSGAVCFMTKQEGQASTTGRDTETALNHKSSFPNQETLRRCSSHENRQVGETQVLFVRENIPQVETSPTKTTTDTCPRRPKTDFEALSATGYQSISFAHHAAPDPRTTNKWSRYVQHQAASLNAPTRLNSLVETTDHRCGGVFTMLVH